MRDLEEDIANRAAQYGREKTARDHQKNQVDQIEAERIRRVEQESLEQAHVIAKTLKAQVDSKEIDFLLRSIWEKIGIKQGTVQVNRFLRSSQLHVVPIGFAIRRRYPEIALKSAFSSIKEYVVSDGEIVLETRQGTLNISFAERYGYKVDIQLRRTDSHNVGYGHTDFDGLKNLLTDAAALLRVTDEDYTLSHGLKLTYAEAPPDTL